MQGQEKLGRDRVGKKRGLGSLEPNCFAIPCQDDGVSAGAPQQRAIATIARVKSMVRVLDRGDGVTFRDQLSNQRAEERCFTGS